MIVLTIAVFSSSINNNVRIVVKKILTILVMTVSGIMPLVLITILIINNAIDNEMNEK